MAACLFHFINVWLFGLYIFPWLMIAATLLFFSPDWPFPRPPTPRLAGTRTRRRRTIDRSAWSDDDPTRLPSVTALFVVWVVVQLVVPLRHFLIEGRPSSDRGGSPLAWH